MNLTLVQNHTDSLSVEPTNRRCNTDEPSADNIRTVGDPPTNRLQTDLQTSDIIDEKIPPDSSRQYKDSSRREKETDVSDQELASQAKRQISNLMGSLKRMPR